MITIQYERGPWWLRLKILFTLGQADSQNKPAAPATPKPKRRSHRTTAFFELP